MADGPFDRRIEDPREGVEHVPDRSENVELPPAWDRPEGVMERLIELERRRQTVRADVPDREPSDVVALLRGRGDTPEDRVGVGRVDIPSRYPADYRLSDADPPDVHAPHAPPEAWADAINPDREEPGRDNNCGECARACEDTWLGRPRVAAAMADANAPGEQVGRMIEWAGVQPRSTSIAEIGRRLGEQGPGSSAVVGCDWVGGGGHWFNAINDKGEIKAVDDQSGDVEPWPPSRDGLGFDETDVERADAIVIDVDGRPVQW